ncbi:MAG TPA: hypothetical protein P5079_07300, partial [Elusimicrobiota bacterium]|nr:hypothetical protein [Elusimicrobiota bacterium]
RLLSWASTVLAGFLAWRIFRSAFGPKTGLWALAWFVFQPISVRYAGTVLTEPLWDLLMLVCFWIHWEGPRDSRWADAALALSAGYACLVRPTGALLVAALMLDAFSRGSFRRAAYGVAAVAVFQGGLSLWTTVHGQGASSFLGQWRFALQGAPISAFVSTVGENLKYYRDIVVFMGVFPLGKWSAVMEGTFVKLPLTVAVWGAVLWGAWRVFQSRHRALAVFFFLNALLMAAWLRPDPRYLMPALFGILFFMVAAVARRPALGEPPELDRRWKRAVCLAGIVLAVLTTGRGVVSAFRGAGPRLPQETLAWIEDHLPSDAGLAGSFASTVYLHVGCRGTDFPRTYVPEDFLSVLLDRGMTHLLVDEGGTTLAALPDVNDWTPVARWMATHPGWYRSLARIPGDKKIVYAIAVDRETYRKAYDLYQEGLRAMKDNRFDLAETYFQKTVETLPDMPGAADRLAQLAFMRGDTRAAEKLLLESLKTWPENILARHHLFQLRGGNDPAEEAELRKLSRRHSYWPLLRPYSKK